MTRKRMRSRRPARMPAPSHFTPSTPALQSDPRSWRDDEAKWPPPFVSVRALIHDGVVYCSFKGCQKRLGELRWPAESLLPWWQCVLVPGYIELPQGKPPVNIGAVVRFTEKSRQRLLHGRRVSEPPLTVECPVELDCWQCGQYLVLNPAGRGVATIDKPKP